MHRPVVFMFSGQGSQYYQMGRELYRSHARFRMWMDHCDEIARPLLGRSLCDLLYRDHARNEPFERLLHTNPALLCFEFSLARVLIEAGVKPAYLLGYSLGEISAATVGGALPLDQAIRFVVDCAKLLETQSVPAGMLAVLEEPSIVTRYSRAFEGCWITAVNFDRHFVVSGATSAIGRLREALLKDGVVCQALAVNVGFHCELLEPMKRPIMALAQGLDFSPLRTPVVSSCNGATLDASFDTDYWPGHLWSVLRHPIAFNQAVQELAGRGDFCFLDVGPSGTLATFVKYLLPADSGSSCSDVINAFGKDDRTFNSALRCAAAAEACSA